MVSSTNLFHELVDRSAHGDQEALSSLVVRLGDPASRDAALSALLVAEHQSLWLGLLRRVAASETEAAPGGDRHAAQRAHNAILSAFAAPTSPVHDAARRKALLLALTEPAPRLRAAAAEALGRRGDSAAIGHLARLLDDADDHVRVAAVRALGAIDDPPQVLPLLIRALERFDLGAAEAVQALQHLGAAAVPALVEELGSPNVWVRWHAARTLAGLSDERAIRPLIAALDDENAAVRWEASRALGRMGPVAVDPLLAALVQHPPTPWFAEGAAHALRRAAGDEYPTLAPLTHRLQQLPVPIDVPVEAARLRAERRRSTPATGAGRD